MSKPWSTTNVLSLFPTLAWRFELDPGRRERINAAILNVLSRQRPAAPASGWQSSNQLQGLPELGEFVDVVERSVQSVLAFSKIALSEIALSGCWANINPPGAAHARHSHPNNYVSGVYYVSVPAGANTIAFHDPRAQAAIIRPPVTELTGTNTDQVLVVVAAGTLLLFPAFLEHSVAVNTSSVERISVSFNVMFASAEALARPQWGRVTNEEPKPQSC